MYTIIKIKTTSPIFTSKCQHGQYLTLKVEYYQCRDILKPMTIIVLYTLRYKKLSKLCIQLLRYKQPVPYLLVNASMDNTILEKWSVSNAGIYKKYFISDTMYITKQMAWHSLY